MHIPADEIHGIVKLIAPREAAASVSAVFVPGPVQRLRIAKG